MKQSLIPSPTLLTLPYKVDSLSYFHTITALLPMALLLQSDAPATAQISAKNTTRGRFDILTAAPEYWLETHNGIQAWHGNNPPSIPLNEASSFAALHQFLDNVQKQAIDYSFCNTEELPFCGGLAGYCSYDLARESIKLENISIRDIDIPDMQFGFYGWACIQDHLKQKSWLVIHPDCDAALQNSLPKLLLNAPENPEPPAPTSRKIPVNETSYSEYSASFEKIQAYINAGDCYQVNLSQRFTSNTDMNALQLYEKLRKAMPSPFCAYLPILGSHDKDFIISFSPERFIQIDSNLTVTTQPIKGTSERYDDPEMDSQSANTLLCDKKNKSENLMIVDLLRNDLGKVCNVGSIKAPRLFELQSFSNVHHLVSTIDGKLKESLNGADVLEACFPGGSITGAPKIRAMQIIEELEPTRRSIYCGSIVCFSANGTMDSNIMIRTVLLRDNNIYCWGGGGIVSDSDCKSEYKESILKVRTLLDSLNI